MFEKFGFYKLDDNEWFFVEASDLHEISKEYYIERYVYFKENGEGVLSNE